MSSDDSGEDSGNSEGNGKLIGMVKPCIPGMTLEIFSTSCHCTSSRELRLFPVPLVIFRMQLTLTVNGAFPNFSRSMFVSRLAESVSPGWIGTRGNTRVETPYRRSRIV